MNDVVIAVEHVVKAFARVTALDDVSLSVRRGELFALLGPNGAGKTTLIRTVLDMIRPDSGSVLVNGRALSDADRARIGYLPEERGLYARRKVGDVLEYFGALKLLPRREARHNAAEWLARLELSEHRDKLVGELSKGNQQKVQLAATLLTKPEIAILDEPFSGLDPVSVRLVMSVIRELHEAGTTIILSSHQMSVVESLCERVMMLNRGRRVLYGPIAEVRREHSDNAVLVRTNAALSSLPGVMSCEHANGVSKVVLRAELTPAEFLRQAVLAGAQIESFQVAVSSLDDIFVKLAGRPRPDSDAPMSGSESVALEAMAPHGATNS